MLIVSGRKQQVILNSLSIHALDCPPLDQNALRKARDSPFFSGSPHVVTLIELRLALLSYQDH